MNINYYFPKDNVFMPSLLCIIILQLLFLLYCVGEFIIIYILPLLNYYSCYSYYVFYVMSNHMYV